MLLSILQIKKKNNSLETAHKRAVSFLCILYKSKTFVNKVRKKSYKLRKINH